MAIDPRVLEEMPQSSSFSAVTKILGIKMKYVFGVIILIVANVLDVIFTMQLLNDGIAVEANPLMAWVIENYGFVWVAFIKVLAIVVISVLLMAVHKKLGKIPKLVATLFWGSVFAYLVLTGWHFYIQAMT